MTSPAAIEEEATISLPSLAFVAVLGFFIYRYFISSRTSSPNSSSSRANGLRFTPAQVDQIAAMFPQLSRRDIMWDLHRNRGSVQATTERVLAGRGLDPAPPSFQPPVALTSTTSSTTTPTNPVSPSPARQPKPEPDLITRYNLQSKISSKGKERADPSPANGWSSNKETRHQMLQRRRDEMILEARRRMQESLNEEGSGSGSGDGTTGT